MGAPTVPSALPTEDKPTTTHLMTTSEGADAAAQQSQMDEYARIRAQQMADYEAQQQQKNMADQTELAAAAQSQQQQIFATNMASLQNPAPQQVQTPDYASRRAGGGFFGAPAMLGQWNDSRGGNPRNTFLGN